MSIEADLEQLVKQFSKFDFEKNCYTTTLEKKELLELDKGFNDLINKWLLNEGPKNENIKKCRNKIVLLFHTDKLISPEVKWIESQLSENLNNGACFKTVMVCYERLTAPERFKISEEYTNIQKRESCREWLERLRNESGTFTSRSFYSSLISLYDEVSNYYDETGKIQTRGIRIVLKVIPILLVTYGTFIFVEEILALYVLCFVMLKSGEQMKSKDALDIKLTGAALSGIGNLTATATSILLVRLMKMVFWASRQCIVKSLQIGASLFPSALTDAYSQEQQAEESLCRDLQLASKKFKEGRVFETPELKWICSPLESYLNLSKQQFFRDWRIGEAKASVIDQFIFSLQVWDRLPISFNEKLEKARLRIEEIKKNEGVYAGKAAKALDLSLQAIGTLNELNNDSPDSNALMPPVL